MNYSVFVLSTSHFAREEHGDQKLNDLKVNQESLVYVPVPVETAPAYLPGLHQMEFTSCDHLKIKKAVVLMSFVTILLRSLCFELLINPNKEFEVFPGSVKIIKQIMKKVLSSCFNIEIIIFQIEAAQNRRTQALPLSSKQYLLILSKGGSQEV